MRRTVVAEDDAGGRKQFLVEDGFDVGFVAVFVGVDEDDVEVACQLFETGHRLTLVDRSWAGVLPAVKQKTVLRVAGRAFDQLDPVIDVVFVKGLARGGDHLRAELKSDDLGFGAFGAFVPGESTVAGITSDLEDCADGISYVWVGCGGKLAYFFGLCGPRP